MDMKVYKRVAWVLMAVMIGVIVYAAVAFQVEDMTVAKGKIDTFNEGWVLVREDGTRTDITLPHVSSCNADEVVVIENRIPEKFWGLTMSFLSADKELEVYIDGRMIYEFGKNDVRKFGHTPGSIYNFIDIPRNLPQGKIQIKMQSHYASYATNIAGIQVAKRDLSILSLFKQNVFPLLCNIIMLLAGIVFLVMALLQVLVIHKSYGVEYLGIYFLCTVGFYSIETKALSVFYGNQTVYSISVFMILMSGPILFCLYYLKNLEELTEQQQRRFRSLLVLSFGNVIVQLILQILDVVDFLDMAPMSHSLIFITLVVVSYTLLQLAKERRVLGYYLEVLGLVFLASGTIIDIIRGNIFHIGDLGKYGRYGFTLFAVITIVVQIRKIMISYMEKIQKSNALLEEKMELLEIQNQELEQARENADAANSAKSDFLANMSHEIRTPINTVLGLNEMIVQETHEKAILGYSQNIKNAANSLLGIINDILDLSKIEAGKMMLVPVEYDLSSMLFDLANMISVRAAGKSLEFQMAVNPDIPAKLYGDDLKLRQIITNLLTNAVKYTHTGMVKLVVDGDVDEDMLLLQVSVEDTGIGIKQKDIDKLFQAFERIEESRNRNIEGTGLGMNITMQLLKMMDGELCVESEYGKGSRFYFEVEQHIVSEEKIGNFAERYHKSRKEEVKEGFLAPKANILVVDDNAMNRKVFAGLLKKN